MFLPRGSPCDLPLKVEISIRLLLRVYDVVVKSSRRSVFVHIEGQTVATIRKV